MRATGAVETSAAEVATTSAVSVLGSAGRPGHGAAGERLSELFARHGAAVLGLCRVLLRHREEAEDAVQQTFLSAYRSLLNGVEPRHPAAWLATIARNECRGRVERRMREPLAVPDAEPASPLPDPVTAAAAKADLAALWRAIGGLPRRQRQALLLREFSGLSYGELATALAVSEPSVESLLFRARRDLRLRLRSAYGSIGCGGTLDAIREALTQATGGLPDPVTSGVAAKAVAAPLVAKLAAGAVPSWSQGGRSQRSSATRFVPRADRSPFRSLIPCPLACRLLRAGHARSFTRQRMSRQRSLGGPCPAGRMSPARGTHET